MLVFDKNKQQKKDQMRSLLLEAKHSPHANFAKKKISLKRGHILLKAAICDLVIRYYFYKNIVAEKNASF